MHKNLQLPHFHAEKPKPLQVLSLFRMFIVGFLLLFSCSLCAQEGFGKTSGAVIIVKGGSTIYSADESFNSQLATKEITILNSEIVSEKMQSKNVLVVSSKKEDVPYSDFQKQLAVAELKKKKEALSVIKKKVDDFESRKDEFSVDKIKVFPSSEEFVGLAHINHDYVAPGSHQSFSNVYVEGNQYFITQALDYLHTQKYTYYNNKSLDFCFSDVFSVRPPPILVI